ncbi:hypothetical protein GH714_033132 [Hevea brasiliensis]|uniref:Cyclin C-terminal domain-containing protein n=1 Tax=Hevea brasiliensis TaxID=3981 RepID=A0A6A6N6U2_HEVBR|nr:hypothetical protein GH714_033132 [Hevea brasiliensis]
MAIQHHDEQQSSSFLLDSALYCEEERWEEEGAEEVCQNESLHVICDKNGTRKNPSSFPLSSLLEQDLFWEDGSFSRSSPKKKSNNPRSMSTMWKQILIPLQLLLSKRQAMDDPTCGGDLSSLAAKVEETQVPLLLDLQVEDTKRLGLKTHLHWQFLGRCERLLLTVVSDSRSTSYLPSALATATMMHVIGQVEPLNPMVYQNQLLGVLKICKEKVIDCYEFILKLSKTKTIASVVYKSHKRKYEPIPRSPSGVIDATVFSSDSSNDYWALRSSVSSSPERLFKKSRAQDQWVLWTSLAALVNLKKTRKKKNLFYYVYLCLFN